MENSESIKLDGYSLMNRLYDAVDILPISATEQALYGYLVHICNKVQWKEVFIVSNDRICNALKVSKSTLINIRNRLVQYGLLFYKSGKSKKQYGTYSFIIPPTGLDSEPNPLPNPLPNPTPKAGNSNKLKTETSLGDFNADEQDKNFSGQKNSVARENFESVDNGPLYEDCLSAYEAFVQKRTQKSAKMDDGQEAALKEIIIYLGMEAPDIGDADAYTLSEWQKILDNWHQLRPWLQNRTLITQINAELQNILSEQTNAANRTQAPTGGTYTPRQSSHAGKTSVRGASINSLQSRKRGGSPNDSERADFTEVIHVE